MAPFLDSLFNGRYAAEKKYILSRCENGGAYSLADLARELDTSIPKISRIVSEMLESGILADLGKQESATGRRPSIYGLNPAAGFFVGVEVGQDSLAIAVTDFPGRLLVFQDDIPYKLDKTEESALGLCSVVNNQLKKLYTDTSLIRGIGVNHTGRVNYRTGYSYSYYISEEKPIRDMFETGFGHFVTIENDSRGMAYGEYMSGIAGDARTILFLNVG